MNHDEQQTEKIIADTKDDLLLKYKLAEPKKDFVRPDLHSKALLMVSFVILYILSALFQLPVLETDYPTNTWNYINMLSLFGIIVYGSFLVGYHKNKYRIEIIKNDVKKS